MTPPALHTALINGEASAVKFLARQSRKREIVAIAQDALMLVSSWNDPESVKIFLPHSKVDKAMASGRTALMAATSIGSAALAALLPHANREQRDKDGFNALMHAIRHRNEEALTLLLHEASEKEINGRIKGGKSAREFAEEIQKEEWWFGLPGHRLSSLFRPLDMMRARIEFVEISNAADAARAKIGLSTAPEGRPRRL